MVKLNYYRLSSNSNKTREHYPITFLNKFKFVSLLLVSTNNVKLFVFDKNNFTSSRNLEFLYFLNNLNV